MSIREIGSLAFVAVMVAALFWDVASRRIPNGLVLLGVAIALVLRSIAGAAAFGAGVLGASLALGFGLPLFALRALGGGDVKLLVAVGAFLGPGDFVSALLASAIVGGVIGVLVALRRGVLLPVLYGVKDLLLHAATRGRSGTRVTLDSPGALKVPYGAAIAIGSLATWLFRMGA